MKKLKLLLCSISLSLVLSSPAYASDQYVEALKQCTEKNITKEDRIILVQWMFSVFASHPDVAEMSKITQKRRDKIDENLANTLINIYLDNCSKETFNVMKYGDSKGMEESGKILGEEALKALMSSPEVLNRAKNFEKHMSIDKF